MKLLQINVTANNGSHGVIAEEIGRLAISRGWESWIAYGREPHKPSDSNLIKIGNKFDFYRHAILTRLFDFHGLSSTAATKDLVDKIKKIEPDIIHLHNIHGYYLNYRILFEYLKKCSSKVVWTFHDCWPMTGHCPYFMFEGCEKWKYKCEKCPLKGEYPKSVLFDNSRYNFDLKKTLFTSLGNRLTIVPVSKCVEGYTRDSFFKDYNIHQIYNGIDLDEFKILSDQKEKMVLGVANFRDRRKGLHDFYKLRELLPKEYKIVLVGVSSKQIENLPDGIIGIARTTNKSELAVLYSKAIAFVNPTYNDSFPTTNLEALACGTPVIVYRTGGSPEAIDEKNGIVVEQGDIEGISNAIKLIESSEDCFLPEMCRDRAILNYGKKQRFEDYLSLYDTILSL